MGFRLSHTQKSGSEPKSEEGGVEDRQRHGEADGDKRSFVSDEDGESWEVDNPEILKEHTGHHVELNCEFNTEKVRYESNDDRGAAIAVASSRPAPAR